MQLDRQADPLLLSLGIHSQTFLLNYDMIEKEIREYRDSGETDLMYGIIADVGREDFFFFCYYVLGLPVKDPFLLARCNEVTIDGLNNTLSLWAREHFKSTLLTYAHSIWLLIKDPEERICIFSHTRGIAQDFLRRIKVTLEENEVLKKAWPDIFFDNPKYQSPSWSVGKGLMVKRKGSFQEASLEAWGLIDAQPIGKHFTWRKYDDFVTDKAVETPGQLRKAIRQYRLSDNLGTRGGCKCMIGTRYSHKDAYGDIMKNPMWTLLCFPSEVEAVGEESKITRKMYHPKLGGSPVFMTREELDAKYLEQGEYVYSTQNLLDPVAAKDKRFLIDWIRYYNHEQLGGQILNKYLIVDKAKKNSRQASYKNDPTAMIAIGVDNKRQIWILDMVRDRLGLADKWNAMVRLTQKWDIEDVYYEQFGAVEDKEYYEERMERDGIYFKLEEFGSKEAKHDRIYRLVPPFQSRKILLPKYIGYQDLEGNPHNLVDEFINEEYLSFPFSTHDDMLDALCSTQLASVLITYPTLSGEDRMKTARGIDPLASVSNGSGGSLGWMAQ